MKVVIDGIEYVPKLDPCEPADESAVTEAVRELTTLYYLYGVSSLCRGAKGCIFRALRLLAPNVAALVEQDADAAYWATHPEREDS